MGQQQDEALVIPTVWRHTFGPALLPALRCGNLSHRGLHVGQAGVRVVDTGDIDRYVPHHDPVNGVRKHHGPRALQRVSQRLGIDRIAVIMITQHGETPSSLAHFHQKRHEERFGFGVP